MAVTVTMPQLGETVTEGTILSWAKQPGDTIAEDEVLLEISTDKVDTEVPSPASGVVQEILVAEGDTVTVGTPLAVIGEAGEGAGDAPTAAQEPVPEATPEPAAAPAPVAEPLPSVPSPPFMEPAAVAPEPAPAPAPAPDPAPTPVAATPTDDAPRRGILSPVVRKLAAEHDLDLDQVPGSGEGGRITRKDVMDFIAAGAAPAPAPTAAPAPAPAAAPAPAKVTLEPAAPPAPAPEPVVPAAAAPAPAAPAPVSTPAQPAPAPAPAPAQPGPAPAPTPAPPPTPAQQPAAAASVPVMDGSQVVDMSRLRKRIATNMVQSKATAAHVWASVEVDYERVERVRQAHKAAFKAREGYSLTYLPFIARATIDALHAYPVVNSSFYLEEGKQVFHNAVNLGIAVDMNQEGLVVVTVKRADEKRMTGLARDIRGLATKARDGNLDPDDISSSTFTITNPGPYGSFMTAPIINVPNVGILSTDTVTKRPTVITLPDGSDSIAIHHIGYLGLTWDHRAFDGSTAVLFLQRIKNNLETWDWEQELS
jgi:2-oxoglutarate dehydrogenase E2 component (dihydrolipoamide succinyltransferase)